MTLRLHISGEIGHIFAWGDAPRRKRRHHSRAWYIYFIFTPTAICCVNVLFTRKMQAFEIIEILLLRVARLHKIWCATTNIDSRFHFSGPPHGPPPPPPRTAGPTPMVLHTKIWFLSDDRCVASLLKLLLLAATTYLFIIKVLIACDIVDDDEVCISFDTLRRRYCGAPCRAPYSHLFTAAIFFNEPQNAAKYVAFTHHDYRNWSCPHRQGLATTPSALNEKDDYAEIYWPIMPDVTSRRPQAEEKFYGHRPTKDEWLFKRIDYDTDLNAKAMSSDGTFNAYGIYTWRGLAGGKIHWKIESYDSTL